MDGRWVARSSTGGREGTHKGMPLQKPNEPDTHPCQGAAPTGTMSLAIALVDSYCL